MTEPKDPDAPKPSRRDRLAAFWRAAPANGRTLGRGVAMVARAAPRATIGYVGLSVLLVGVPTAQIWLAKVIVDRLVAGGDPAQTVDRLLIPGLLYAATMVVPAALQPILFWMVAIQEERAVGIVDRAILGAAARMPDLGQIERPAFHDQLRLVGEAPQYLPGLFPFVQLGIGTIVSMLGVLALLGGLHPLIPVILAVAAVPHLVLERRLVQVVWSAMQDRARPAREMDYCVRAATEPDAAKEIRVFGLGEFFLDRYRSRYRAARDEFGAIRRRHLRDFLLFGGTYSLALGGGFAYVAREAGAGRLTAGDVALYLNAVIQAQATIGGIPFWLGGLYALIPPLSALLKLQDEAGPTIAVAPPGTALAVPNPSTTGIALCEVGFSYPESTAPVLQAVTADLPAAKITAIVGANGAGKSTLVKLLTRLYDPSTGQLLLDGEPLAAYDLDQLRANTGSVFQDFAQFALTFSENVAAGGTDPDGVDEHRIKLAAEWAGADEVAAKLAAGYDTELTRRFDGGTDLSGGEWQKIALARGAIRNAPILLLDEPNAALDADAEHRLLERLRELARGRTVLLISHRLSTVRMADQILVLEDGRVTESGSHDDLMARGGRYATLFAMQADRYREEEDEPG